MIRIEDFGEIAYGGAVTWAEWWDDRRILAGDITNKDVFRKASTYAYLGIGLVATLMSVFGWMRQWERWTEHLSHGFLYDLPRFAKNLIDAMGTTAGSGSAAIQEANRLLADNRRVALKSPARTTQRTYQPEMEPAVAF